MQSRCSALSRYDSRTADHVELMSIVKRAAVLTQRLLRKSLTANPGSRLSSGMFAMIDLMFPLDREFFANIHHMDFSLPKGGLTMSSNYKTKEVAMGGSSAEVDLAEVCDQPPDQSVRLTWFHAAAMHQLWMTVSTPHALNVLADCL